MRRNMKKRSCEVLQEMKSQKMRPVVHVPMLVPAENFPGPKMTFKNMEIGES
jgi:hypothetical protein